MYFHESYFKSKQLKFLQHLKIGHFTFFSGCAHELCVKCVRCLCSANNITSQVAGPLGSVSCPLCRNGIVSFVKLAHIPEVEEAKLTKYKSLCNPPHDANQATITCRSEFCGNSMPASFFTRTRLIFSFLRVVPLIESLHIAHGSSLIVLIH